MSKSIAGSKIAILVANGFTEQDLTFVQRALQSKGAHPRIIGMDQGLVNSWTGESWGHHFAADQALNTALAADYDMLVVPSGRRSVEKLKLTAHTRRFIGGFMDADKPVAVLGDAVELLAFAERAGQRKVAAVENAKTIVSEAGASVLDAAIVIDDNLITGYDADINVFVEAVIAHFSNQPEMQEAA